MKVFELFKIWSKEYTVTGKANFYIFMFSDILKELHKAFSKKGRASYSEMAADEASGCALSVEGSFMAGRCCADQIADSSSGSMVATAAPVPM